MTFDIWVINGGRKRVLKGCKQQQLVLEHMYYTCGSEIVPPKRSHKSKSLKNFAIFAANLKKILIFDSKYLFLIL